MILSSVRSFILGMAFVGFSSVFNTATAAPLRFHFDIDTSTLAGESVSLFFAASGTNDGPGSAVGNEVIVSNFATDATMQYPATPFGLTTGDLTSTVSLPFDHENAGVNAKGQYEIGAVLGNSISFDILLKGDQLEGTNIVPYAGFEFTVSQNFVNIWLSPSGFASAEVYQLDGVLGFESVPQITITPITVPEPGTISLFVAACGLIAFRR